MYFNGVSNQEEFQASILLASPDRAHTPIPVKLDIAITNNVTEYKGCIIRLQVSIEIGVKNVQVYGGSNSVINQIP